MWLDMPLRSGRGTAGVPFHIINRGARRLALFETGADYRAFLHCLNEALAKVPVRLLAFCLMPNHFHLIAQPQVDGQLSKFMKALLGTHGQRWHAYRGTAGLGAVYQGRFKAFPIQTNAHFYTVCHYVERNALRANLVDRAEDWPWSSLFFRCQGLSGAPLSEWPIPIPVDWVERVNQEAPLAELEAIRLSVVGGRPLGDDSWIELTARTQGLERSIRPRGRPPKEKTSGAFVVEKGTRRLF